VIPESATTQVKELFVLPVFLDAARTEAQTLLSLEISEVLSYLLFFSCLHLQTKCFVVTFVKVTDGIRNGPVVGVLIAVQSGLYHDGHK